MPTTFTTGTVSEPDAGSVGLSMMNQWRDDLLAHPAWELVEEFTPSGGTYRYCVVKCLATESGLDDDFHVILSRRLADGALIAILCEEYDSSTHTAKYFARQGYTQDVDFDASGRDDLTYILTSAGLGGGDTYPNFYFWSPGGTSTRWWLSVYDDGFTIAFNGLANGWINCGAYTPLTTLSIGTPIMAQGSAAAVLTPQGVTTRNPAAASITGTASALYFTPDNPLGFAADLRYNDKLQNDQRMVAEIGMRVYERLAGDRELYGSALGKLNHVRLGGTLPPGTAFGDAYVLEGRLWVPYSPTDSRLWDTGAASS